MRGICGISSPRDTQSSAWQSSEQSSITWKSHCFEWEVGVYDFQRSCTKLLIYFILSLRCVFLPGFREFKSTTYNQPLLTFFWCSFFLYVLVPSFSSALFCSFSSSPYTIIPTLLCVCVLPFFCPHLALIEKIFCYHDNYYRNALNASSVKVTYYLSYSMKWPELAYFAM